MPKRQIIDPKKVWIPEIKIAPVNKDLLDKVEINGWRDIPPIPVLIIPPEFRYNHIYEYIAFGGRKRLLIARMRNDHLPALIYNITEKVEFSRNRLARKDMGLTTWDMISSFEQYKRAYGIKSDNL